MWICMNYDKAIASKSSKGWFELKIFFNYDVTILLQYQRIGLNLN